MGQQAKQAALVARRASTEEKNRALTKIAEAITEATPEIIRANAVDLKEAQAQGLDAPSQDRLRIDAKGIASMVAGLEQIIALQDPVGQIKDTTIRPNGLSIGKMRTPLGVIGMVYESRPNVTVDAAGLCLKSVSYTHLTLPTIYSV